VEIRFIRVVTVIRPALVYVRRRSSGHHTGPDTDLSVIPAWVAVMLFWLQNNKLSAELRYVTPVDQHQFSRHKAGQTTAS